MVGEDLGETHDQIEGHLEEGRRRRAADSYLDLGGRKQREIRQMLPEQTAETLRRAVRRRNKELDERRRLLETLTEERREAWDTMVACVDRAAGTASKREAEENLSRAAKVWRRVRQQLKSAEQEMVLDAKLPEDTQRALLQRAGHKRRQTQGQDQHGDQSQGGQQPGR